MGFGSPTMNARLRLLQALEGEIIRYASGQALFSQAQGWQLFLPTARTEEVRRNFFPYSLCGVGIGCGDERIPPRLALCAKRPAWNGDAPRRCRG